MINKELFEQLQDVVKNQEEPIVLVEQPSAYEGETLRLVYIPEDECFLVGPNAEIGYEGDGKTIYPSYLRNIAEVVRGIFESEEVWIQYVVSLWTAHSLNAHFVKDLDPSYHLFSTVQAITSKTEEDSIEVNKLVDESTIVYYPPEKMIRHLDKEGEVLEEQSIEDKDPDIELVKFVSFWERRNEEVIKQKITETQQDSNEVKDDLEDEVFDLDNLYDGVEGNSANPIDTSKPEEVEDVGCTGGGCTL